MRIYFGGRQNPEMNGIPTSKFDRLTRILDEFTNRGRQVCRRENSLFWLDTVCCLLQSGKGRKLVISRMRRMYEQAQEVLVLENALRHCRIARHAGQRELPADFVFFSNNQSMDY